MSRKADLHMKATEKVGVFDQTLSHVSVLFVETEQNLGSVNSKQRAFSQICVNLPVNNST